MAGDTISLDRMNRAGMVYMALIGRRDAVDAIHAAQAHRMHEGIGRAAALVLGVEEYLEMSQ